MKGKDRCEILKKIRSEFAQKNDVDYSPSECNHDGDCYGVCPKCEEEAEMLLKMSLEQDAEALDIVSLDETKSTDNILLIDGNYQMDVDDGPVKFFISEDETLGGDISEVEILGEDIMIDARDVEGIIDRTEQDSDYLASDEDKGDDYV